MMKACNHLYSAAFTIAPNVFSSITDTNMNSDRYKVLNAECYILVDSNSVAVLDSTSRVLPAIIEIYCQYEYFGLFNNSLSTTNMNSKKISNLFQLLFSYLQNKTFILTS